MSRLPSDLGRESEIFGMELPPFLVMGVCGLGAGVAVLAGLGLWSGVPTAVLTAVAVAALTSFVVAGLVRKTFRGTDRHVLLSDLLLALAAGAAIARATGQPVSSVLDLLVVGIGAFLVAGRIGCLFGGCCHGRPSRLGVRYQDDTAVDAHLVGIRLFPVQLVEAAWIALVTAVGLAMVLARLRPGTAVWWWLLAYGAGRFVLEFARGDTDRRFAGPLSPAQWLVIAILLGRVAQEEAVRPQPAHLMAVGSAALVVLLAYLTRARWLDLPRWSLRRTDVPRWRRLLTDLESAAEAQGNGEEQRRPLPVGEGTISLSVSDTGDGRTLYAYALQETPGPLDERLAFNLAGLIVQGLPEYEVIRANACHAGVFHLWVLVPADRVRGAVPAVPAVTAVHRARAFAWQARP